jgi:diguanylate cyclase (GGDEF)-like protein
MSSLSRTEPTIAAPASFPIRSLRLGILAMILLMLTSIALTWRVGENIREDVRSQINVITAAQKVDHYGSLLEMSIKAVVTSGDSEAAARYRSVQPMLRETLSQLRRELQATQQGGAIANVDKADLELIAMEYQALDLAGKGRLDEARQIVDSRRYDYLVDAYFEGVQGIERHAAMFVEETRRRLDFYLWLVIAMSGMTLALVVLGWFTFVAPVRRWGGEIEVARGAAERSAAELADKQRELEGLNQRLFRQARVDPLTGLATRLSFNEDAPRWLLTDIAPHQYCAAMCDVDHFKQFNDSRGHLAGDQALQLVAEAIRGAIGPDDRAYRLGGEEFLVVMKAASARAAAARAERMRQAIAELGVPHPASPLGFVTVSVGVAALDRAGGMSIERWLGLADQAMYKAKNGGRNRVSLDARDHPAKVESIDSKRNAAGG